MILKEFISVINSHRSRRRRLLLPRSPSAKLVVEASEPLVIFVSREVARSIEEFSCPQQLIAPASEGGGGLLQD